jgi:tRNA (guanine10-N2)-dimethyltransferase
MKLFVLSQENLALSVAEAELLHGELSSGLIDNFLLLDVEEYLHGLAFTKEIHEVLYTAKLELLTPSLNDFSWSLHVESPFVVRTRGERKTGNAPVEEKELAGFIWRSLEQSGKEPSVSLDAPKTEVHLFYIKDYFLCAKLLWRNDDHFFARRAHLRPRNHPTSLNPKLARAMVNLAGKPSDIKTMLDPFCGSGGILLEGALASREMTGTDIDAQQIARAEENLAAYDRAATLSVHDAMRCDLLGKFDAIVTDLPLGRSAKLEHAEETFRAFFEAASRITDRIVVACDASFRLETLFQKQWRPRAAFDWYVHKGLTKRVFVLQREAT